MSKVPPWNNHPEAITWEMELACKKCNEKRVVCCHSNYSGLRGE